MKRYLTFALVAFSLYSCGDEAKDDKKSKDLTELKDYSALKSKATKLFKTPEAIASVDDNEISPELIALGKKLFYDNRLSDDNTISCNSCHNIENFGVDNKKVSEGINGQLGKRNSPTVLNAAFHISQFWDGRAKDVEEQAGMPILNPEEMGIKSEAALEKKLSAIEEYTSLFNAAYGDQNISFNRIKNAIAAFERTLITNNTRFDKYLAGNEFAISNAEKEGLELFLDYGCTTCHSGTLLGGNMMQKFGVYGNYWDFTKGDSTDTGRQQVTGNEMDAYMFKVPSLRNISKTGPYFHDGSVSSLDEAIVIMGASQLDKEISAEEAAYIAQFLKSLDGKIKNEWLNN